MFISVIWIHSGLNFLRYTVERQLSAHGGTAEVLITEVLHVNSFSVVIVLELFDIILNLDLFEIPVYSHIYTIK